MYEIDFSTKSKFEQCKIPIIPLTTFGQDDNAIISIRLRKLLVITFNFKAIWRSE